MERSFKDRLCKHRNSLRHRTKANATELSKYVWDLRDRNIEEINIEWSISGKALTYRNGSKTCNVCLSEKFHIIFHNKGNLLETNSSFQTSKRRHRIIKKQCMQGRSERLMNGGGGGGAVEKFPNSLEYFRTKFFTIFSIVSDVAITNRVFRRPN